MKVIEEYTYPISHIMLNADGSGNPFGWQAGATDGTVYAIGIGKTKEQAVKSAEQEIAIFRKKYHEVF